MGWLESNENLVRMENLEEQSEDDTGKVSKYHEKDVFENKCL
jgi:hypothetical protein